MNRNLLNLSIVALTNGACLAPKRVSSYGDQLHLELVLPPADLSSNSAVTLECVLTPRDPWAIDVDFIIRARSRVVVCGSACSAYVAPNGAGGLTIVQGLAPELLGFEWDAGYVGADGYTILERDEEVCIRGTIALDVYSAEPAYPYGIPAKDLTPVNCSVSYWEVDEHAEIPSLTSAFLKQRRFATSLPILMRGSDTR